MSRVFSKKWEEEVEGLKGVLRPSKPLKPKINGAVRRMEAQLSRINGYIEQYSARDKDIFEKMVNAFQKHDDDRVKMYANELAEMRKQKRILSHSKLSLDNAALRLRTIFEFGNFVSVLSSSVEIIDEVKKNITGIVPDVGGELSRVETTLNDIMIDVGQNMSGTIGFDMKTEEAEKIIKEAALVAEGETGSIFPDLPASVSEGGRLIIKKDDETK